MNFMNMMGGAGGGDTELYDLLGVKSQASMHELKMAYDKLSKRNANNPEKMEDIEFAYNTLIDDDKRASYDRYGMSGVGRGGGSSQGFSSFGGGFEGNDIFSSIFGGGGGGMEGHPFGSLFGMSQSSRGRQTKRKGKSVGIPVEVTLEQLFNGSNTSASYERDVICHRCKGAGGKAGAVSKCRECRGQGVVMKVVQHGPGMVMQTQSACHKCRGKGEIIDEKDRCKTCQGAKVNKKNKELEVIIEPGMSHGQKIPFAGQGDQHPDIEPGDIVVILQMKQHDLFKRVKDDLFYECNVSLSDALTGCIFTIQHLDGRILLVTYPPGKIIYHGCIKGVRGEGMARRGHAIGRGNLYVKFNVIFPENIYDEEQLKMLEQVLGPRKNRKIPSTAEQVDMFEVEATKASETDDDEDKFDEKKEKHAHYSSGPGCTTQ